jgi:hypothetical protein
LKKLVFRAALRDSSSSDSDSDAFMEHPVIPEVFDDDGGPDSGADDRAARPASDPLASADAAVEPTEEEAEATRTRRRYQRLPPKDLSAEIAKAQAELIDVEAGAVNPPPTRLML